MRWYILILAFVVLGSGCIDNSQEDSVDQEMPDQTSIPTELMNNSTENTIYLTDSGFVPSEITVEEGETVSWINNGSSSMWVATDEHPSHTNYAGSQLYQHCNSGDQTEAAFDQCSSGDQFSFTFEKTGEWDYHNHDSARQTGTVIVE